MGIFAAALPPLISGLFTLAASGINAYGANEANKETSRMNDVARQQYEGEQAEDKRRFRMNYAAGRSDTAFNQNMQNSQSALGGVNQLINLLNSNDTIRSNYIKMTGGR
jgi:hypothetical protein